MEFTYNQKMSIVRLLLDIIRVDGKIDARETFLFEEINNELGLLPEDHFKANEYNTLLSLCVIKAMTPEQKKAFSDMVVRMILADEEVMDNERIAYMDICEFCKIEPVSL
ncbi:MAG: hypothetical protein J5897_05965 [Candidatus Methanomethylophilus sp.]|nr:hypothetical protein [Methanomethylophilus sp.]